MLVIMDMEWLEWCCRSNPTQISALRVTEDWEEDSRFDRIIHPDSEQKTAWDHMGFTGYGKVDFLSAADAASVFGDLHAWMKPGDVLCWWGTATAATFAAVWHMLFRVAPPFFLRQIKPAITEKLRRAGAPVNGSAYGMAETLGIPLCEKEHCSADDVNVMRLLLRFLHADPEKILHCALPEGTERTQMRDLHKTQDSSGKLKYILDLTNRMAHVSTCEMIPAGSEAKTVATMETVIRSLLPPCSCCKKEYWQFSGKRAAENIRKMQLNYVYSEKSQLFHKTTCVNVKKMPYPQIHGSVRYDTAVQHGYNPCGFCKPRPEDEKEPLYARQEKAAVAPAKPKKAQTPYDRCLNRYEHNAVKRHEQAVKERAALPSNLRGQENKDAFVLSSSDFAFWAAEGYQTFHLRNCPKLKGLSHLHGYGRFSEAARFGLTPCKLCRPTKKHDIIASVPMNQKIRKAETEEQINAYCERRGWKHSSKDGVYYIETPVAKWKLYMGTYPLEVYHMPEGRDEYHKQHRTFLSMTDTVEYIRRHDESVMGENNRDKAFDRMVRDARSSYIMKVNEPAKVVYA